MGAVRGVVVANPRVALLPGGRARRPNPPDPVYAVRPFAHPSPLCGVVEARSSTCARWDAIADTTAQSNQTSEHASTVSRVMANMRCDGSLLLHRGDITS